MSSDKALNNTHTHHLDQEVKQVWSTPELIKSDSIKGITGQISNPLASSIFVRKAPLSTENYHPNS
ncbi:MAG: hypothetical protein F6K42_08970 [Leptolyngbya sp. SIO1D8]|nr:hypothetical protein [Leptolyngbya sp. SIO1D8]